MSLGDPVGIIWRGGERRRSGVEATPRSYMERAVFLVGLNVLRRHDAFSPGMVTPPFNDALTTILTTIGAERDGKVGEFGMILGFSIGKTKGLGVFGSMGKPYERFRKPQVEATLTAANLVFGTQPLMPTP